MVTTVIRTTVMTRWYSVASAYRPGVGVHNQNDAHQLRIFKRATGVSVHTKPAAAWATWAASGMGMIRAEDQYAVTVVREWMRHHYQAGAHFRGMQRDYLKQVYEHQGGCPEVMLPGSAPIPNFPHLWASLREVVKRVGIPPWMPGRCEGKTPILMGTGGKR